MYKKEIIKQTDGTIVTKLTRIPMPETRTKKELENMERMQKALQEFGTSS